MTAELPDEEVLALLLVLVTLGVELFFGVLFAVVFWFGAGVLVVVTEVVFGAKVGTDVGVTVVARVGVKARVGVVEDAGCVAVADTIVVVLMVLVSDVTNVGVDVRVAVAGAIVFANGRIVLGVSSVPVFDEFVGSDSPVVICVAVCIGVVVIVAGVIIVVVGTADSTVVA